MSRFFTQWWCWKIIFDYTQEIKLILLRPYSTPKKVYKLDLIVALCQNNKIKRYRNTYTCFRDLPWHFHLNKLFKQMAKIFATFIFHILLLIIFRGNWHSFLICNFSSENIDETLVNLTPEYFDKWFSLICLFFCKRSRNSSSNSAFLNWRVVADFERIARFFQE